MDILIYVIIVCILITISIVIGFLVYTKKTNNSINKISKFINNIDIPDMSPEKRLELTENFLKFIDSLIDYEVINYNRKSIFLAEKSRDEVNYDDIITGISSSVFNGISVEYLTNPNLILTKEYLTRYIAKRSFIKYMKFLNDYNENT